MNDLKSNAIKLYNEGMTMQQIADKYGCSRQYISQLLKNEEKRQLKNDKRTIKLYKYKKANKIYVYVPVSYLKAIGLNTDTNTEEYVNVELKEDKIIITKHK